MLTHPTLDKLHALKLLGMVRALEEQLHSPEIHSLTFEERLGLLVDREMTAQENRRLHRRLKNAKLRQTATLEDIDFRHPRELDKSVVMSLADCRWVKSHNVLITGPTGVGKTYLACALAEKACREGFSVQYLRMPRLFQELAMARGDGRYGKLMTAFARTELLVLDDWGLTPLTDMEQRDLLEILEDRHGLRSTIVTSQVPVELWHEAMGGPTLADAILDRLVHNAYKIALTGESMRKRRSKTAATAAEEK